MSDKAPSGVDCSAPVETSVETGVNLTIVTTQAFFTSQRYQILLLQVVMM